MVDSSETTDRAVYRTSGEEIAPWNRQRIVDALLRSGYRLSAGGGKFPKTSKSRLSPRASRLLTTSLVRELVNAKLIERGLEKERRLHGRLGFPL